MRKLGRFGHFFCSSAPDHGLILVLPRHVAIRAGQDVLRGHAAGSQRVAHGKSAGQREAHGGGRVGRVSRGAGIHRDHARSRAEWLSAVAALPGRSAMPGAKPASHWHGLGRRWGWFWCRRCNHPGRHRHRGRQLGRCHRQHGVPHMRPMMHHHHRRRHGHGRGRRSGNPRKLL